MVRKDWKGWVRKDEKKVRKDEKESEIKWLEKVRKDWKGLERIRNKIKWLEKVRKDGTERMRNKIK